MPPQQGEGEGGGNEPVREETFLLYIHTHTIYHIYLLTLPYLELPRNNHNSLPSGYSGFIILAIPNGIRDQITEVFNVRQCGHTVRTLSGIGGTADETMKKVTFGITGI